MQDLDFRNLVGHQAPLGTLRKGGRREPFPSLVLGGPSRIGKRLCGVWYAAFLNCLQTDELAPCGECPSCKKVVSGSHPDLHFTRVPEKKTVVGVSDVREAIHEIHHAPFEGNFRIWVIEEGERLTDEAQNALLKTLEEPPRRAIILLVTNLVGTLLPTVSSRCRLVRFGSLGHGEVLKSLQSQGADEKTASNLASLCGGSLGLALTLLREPGMLEEQENILQLFGDLPGRDLWGAIETAQTLEKSKHTSHDALIGLGLSLYRDLLLLSAGSPDLIVHKSRMSRLEQLASQVELSDIRSVIKEFQEAEHYLQRNVSPRLLFQRLCVNVSRSL
ncbi:MAG: DNA polymerase III subunit delta' [Candidatus Eremiobacteraeota bacterium]|nr:DNA polymerase III subunit delta' [Candidatus Eremiobacteraeota bacterium]